MDLSYENNLCYKSRRYACSTVKIALEQTGHHVRLLFQQTNQDQQKTEKFNLH